MGRIAVLDDYQQVALTMANWSALRDRHEIHVFSTPFTSPEEAASALASFDRLAIMRERTPFPTALFEALPALKFMVTSGMRNLSIDLDAARARGVVVSGTPSPGVATAELAIGLMLALARSIPQEHANMRAGRWQTTVGRDLAGSTLGLIGLGRLGARVARVAQAFEMDVIAWSANLTDARAADVGVTRVSKDELYERADVISVHTVLSERTRGLIDRDAFARMRSHALLINTSRGPIIEDAALREALDAGRIGGVGLDVYDHEPLAADHWLRDHPRAVLTPHLGYVTQQTYEVFYAGMVAALEAYDEGAPINVLT
ncbi:MAG: D-2-hydroxyacid dehydrogenase family protein [Pseudomonadota bacterium]